jgi:DNA helicase-2/ATP-dependent DNA helicase PcrA
MDEKILHEENIKSKSFVSKINNSIDKMTDDMSFLQEDSIRKLKEIREQGLTSRDAIDSMNDIQNQVDSFDSYQKIQHLNELYYLKDNPFFARIDLKEESSSANSDSYYISKFGFIEEATPILIDWRAKLASIYYNYRYPQKSVSYMVDDKKFTYDLTLKRTFEMDGSFVLKYFNNDIGLSEAEIINSKTKNRTGGVLEDIIETIQADQMKIIESALGNVCLVQGCVGSGKSTVAIHKLSYLYFNYPNLISPQKSLLVSKSRVLVDYLSSLFPKLGIFDIKYMTLRDLLFRHLTLEKIPAKFNLELNQDVSELNLDFVKDLQSKIENSKKECLSDIGKILNQEKFNNLINFKFDFSSPIFENLDNLLFDINESISNIKDSIREEKGDFFQVEKFKMTYKVYSDLRKEISSRKSIVLKEHFKSLTTFYKVSSFLGYKEALIYLIIYYEFYGFSHNPIFEYCVIDEAQDLSVLEFLFLQKNVLKNRFCIIGDLNQNLHNKALSSWEDLDYLFGEERIERHKLETNFRSTKNIIDYANKVLSPFTSKYLPKPIEKFGKDVLETKLDSLNDFSKMLENDYQNLEKSIGIIFFNDERKSEIIKIATSVISDASKLITLDELKKGFYTPRGVYLVDFKDCKGLEFNKVYLFGANTSNIKDFEQAKQVFVGITRAMNELVIVN